LPKDVPDDGQRKKAVKDADMQTRVGQDITNQVSMSPYGQSILDKARAKYKRRRPDGHWQFERDQFVNKSLLKVVSGFDLVVVRDKSRKLVLSVYSQVMQRHFPGGTLEKYHKAIEDCAWLNPLPKPDHRYALEEDENLENIRTLILSTPMIRILRRMVSSTMVPLPFQDTRRHHACNLQPPGKAIRCRKTSGACHSSIHL
jgi:hypothetical protein